jgi:coproporphyrinogen III oxidase
MEGGGVFEKAAANVSVIRGTLSKERAAAMSRTRQTGCRSKRRPNVLGGRA